MSKILSIFLAACLSWNASAQELESSGSVNQSASNLYKWLAEDPMYRVVVPALVLSATVGFGYYVFASGSFSLVYLSVKKRLGGKFRLPRPVEIRMATNGQSTAFLNAKVGAAGLVSLNKQTGDHQSLYTGAVGDCGVICVLAKKIGYEYSVMQGYHGAGGFEAIDHKSLFADIDFNNDGPVKLVTVNGYPEAEVGRALKNFLTDNLPGFAENPNIELQSFWSTGQAVIDRFGRVWTGSDMRERFGDSTHWEY